MLWSIVSCDLGEVVSGTLFPSGGGRICNTGEICFGFAVGSSNLNLRSGKFKFHDVMSRQASAIKYAR